MCNQDLYRGRRPIGRWPKWMNLPMEFWTDREMREFLMEEGVI